MPCTPPHVLRSSLFTIWLQTPMCRSKLPLGFARALHLTLVCHHRQHAGSVAAMVGVKLQCGFLQAQRVLLELQVLHHLNFGGLQRLMQLVAGFNVCIKVLVARGQDLLLMLQGLLEIILHTFLFRPLSSDQKPPFTDFDGAVQRLPVLGEQVQRLIHSANQCPGAFYSPQQVLDETLRHRNSLPELLEDSARPLLAGWRPRLELLLHCLAQQASRVEPLSHLRVAPPGISGCAPLRRAQAEGGAPAFILMGTSMRAQPRRLRVKVLLGDLRRVA
mmetsp:Transcript_93351/g.221973  ORF Transcript_93351/g.221973 Transcript_93351/m.221973 type:complete len:275 (+) Transcript_93351:1431-2255(+)